MAFHLPAGLGQDRPPSGSSTDYLTIIFFNYYVSTYPGSSEQCISYADNFTAFASNTKVDRAADTLTEHAGYITYWAQAEEPPYLGSEIFEFKNSSFYTSTYPSPWTAPLFVWKGTPRS